jgi:catechol 2,3-dioxygenase-like lactoylglutathione lyase family enzyme
MDMKLEVVVLPVSDVERAKRFYEKLGFRLDVDVAPNENYRAVHLTPPGSQASILFGKGVTSAQPGSIDRLVLAVYDIDAARGELLSRGVEMSEVFHDAGDGLGGGSPAGYRLGRCVGQLGRAMRQPAPALPGPHPSSPPGRPASPPTGRARLHARESQVIRSPA